MIKLQKRRFVHLLTGLCICLLPQITKGQITTDIKPVSPTISTLGKFSEMPVNLHTGIPVINIPIYEIEIDGFKLPISIAYHAGGIKVDEGASNVGLGWALNAGGVGFDRERAPRYDTVRTWNPEFYNTSSTVNTVDGYGNPVTVINGLMYYARPRSPTLDVSAPGIKLKFHMDDSSRMVQFPPMTLAATSPEDRAVINEAGIKYYFNTAVYAGNNSFYRKTDPTAYLEKVVTPNGQEIKFNYGASYIYNTGGFNESIFFPKNSVSPYFHKRAGGIVTDSVDREFHSASHIQEIICSNGLRVEFVYAGARKDIVGDSKLTNIYVFYYRNGEKVILRKVTFYQSYFETKYFEKRGTSPVNNSIFYRMRLDSVDIGGNVAYTPQRYRFEYNENDLPEKSSFSQDLWGFYNGAPNQFLIPPMTHTVGPSGRAVTWQTPAVNRLADSLGPLSAVLNKITYPTGGYTTFEYESNTVSENPYPSQYAYNGIPYGETVIEYPIVPKTVPTGGGGTLREDIYTEIGPYYFTINSRQRISGRYGKMARFEYGYLPGTTDAGPYEIKVEAVTFDSVFTATTGSKFLPNGIYRFTIKNTSTSDNWDWAKCRLIIHDPGFTTAPSLPAYNYRAAGIRVKKVVEYDGRNHANDIVKYYKYHQFDQPGKSSGKLTTTPSDYSRDEMNVNTPKHAYRPGSTVRMPFPTRELIASKETEIRNGQAVEVFRYNSVQSDNSTYIEIPDFFDAAILQQSYEVISANTGYPMQDEFASYVGYSNVTVEYGDNGEHGKKEFDFTNTGLHWQRGLLLKERTYSKKDGIFKLINTDQTDYYIDTSWYHPVATIQTSIGNLPGGTAVENKTFHEYGLRFLPQPTAVKTLNSTGDTLMTVNRYPKLFEGGTATDPLTMGVLQLLKKNMLLSPVEQSSYQIDKGTSTLELLGSSFIHYRSDVPLVDTIYKIELAAPLTNFSDARLSQGRIVKDPAYKPYTVVGRYDVQGNILEANVIGHEKKAYIWDYDKMYPVAIVVNADSASIAYTSFETNADGGWQVSNVSRNSLEAATGNTSFTFQSGDNICRNGLPAYNRYIVSYWSRNGSLSVSGSIQRTQAGGNGWTYYEHLLPSNTTSICLTGNGITIDELRLYPVNAQMTTQTYERHVGMSSQCSASNVITHYRYDAWGRLQLLLDVDKSVLKSYEYNFKKSAGSSL